MLVVHQHAHLFKPRSIKPSNCSIFTFAHLSLVCCHSFMGENMHVLHLDVPYNYFETSNPKI